MPSHDATDSKELKVATFASLKTGPPVSRRLTDVLDDIRNGRWANTVNLARTRFLNGDDAGSRTAKESLPTFFASGEASSRKTMLNHSGIVQIDLDKLNGTLSLVRSAAQSSPHVRAAFLSPRGDGLKVLVAVDASNGHQPAYAAAVAHILSITGHHPDPSCSPVNKHCFVSFDPALYSNITPLQIIKKWDTTIPLSLSPQLCCVPSAQSSSYLSQSSSYLSTAAAPPPGRTYLLRPPVSVEQPGEIVSFPAFAFAARNRHESFRKLGQMACSLRSREARLRCITQHPQLLSIFWSWWNVSFRYVDSSKPASAYLRLWFAAYKGATTTDNTITRAISAVQHVQQPINRLIALCHALSDANGRFHLDCRTAAKVAGVSRMTASRWLSSRCGLAKLASGSYGGGSNQWQITTAPATPLHPQKCGHGIASH